MWWAKNRGIYPRLSRMALDYLSIPGMCSHNFIRAAVLNLNYHTLAATSVDVERVFSKGRLVLSHIRNGLSVQSTRASMCLGNWSRMGLVMDKDVMEATKLPDVSGREEELASDWDEVVDITE